MGLNNYHYQYKTQSINTMTNSEMLLLLLDELVKRISRAELALEKEDYLLFEQSVTRASDIVLYLKNTLDRQFVISRELRSMYDFFIYELSRAKSGRNRVPLQEVKPLAEELRDAFRQAAKVTTI